MRGRIVQGPEITGSIDETCDVLVIGSGAGGAVLAQGLVEWGLDVVMLEAGAYHTRKDFDLDEGRAYQRFYQDRGGRSTADRAVTILQGRVVGGSTTVNWTTCFRTPAPVLEHWESQHGIQGLDPESLAPFHDVVEQRLGVATWQESLANENNRALLRGARALGYEAAPLRRNVRGCANSGMCGLGCPVDAKQSMHVTMIPDAVQGGLRLYSDVQVDSIETNAQRVVQVHGTVMHRGTEAPTDHVVRVRPRVVALCGGAINSPAVLLRSGLDANRRVGRRTFLHPVVAVIAEYKHRIDPYFGAPQSVGSHQFATPGSGEVGYFLEAAPSHPVLASTAVPVFGSSLEYFMSRLPYYSSLIALHIDGFLPRDEGGTVTLRSDGRPQLDYPIRRPLVEAMRRSHDTLARIHFAAGCTQASTLHTPPFQMSSSADVAGLADLAYGAHRHTVFSAHQMGGCAMGGDPATSVVDAQHRHHEVPNLFVVDGSVLPTSLGVNPSQTIYAMAMRAREFVGNAV